MVPLSAERTSVFYIAYCRRYGLHSRFLQYFPHANFVSLSSLSELCFGQCQIEEFDRKAVELERQGNLVKKAEKGELLCEHRGSGEPHFAHGLCQTCYGEVPSTAVEAML